jgi:hypothetical protein
VLLVINLAVACLADVAWPEPKTPDKKAPWAVKAKPKTIGILQQSLMQDNREQSEISTECALAMAAKRA